MEKLCKAPKVNIPAIEDEIRKINPMLHAEQSDNLLYVYLDSSMIEVATIMNLGWRLFSRVEAFEVQCFSYGVRLCEGVYSINEEFKVPMEDVEFYIDMGDEK